MHFFEEFYHFFGSLMFRSDSLLYHENLNEPKRLLTPEQAFLCCSYALEHAPYILEPLLNYCPHPDTFVNSFHVGCLNPGGTAGTLITAIMQKDNAAALDCLFRHGLDPNLKQTDPDESPSLHAWYETPFETALAYSAANCLARLLAEPDLKLPKRDDLVSIKQDISDDCGYLLDSYLNAHYLKEWADAEDPWDFPWDENGNCDYDDDEENSDGGLETDEDTNAGVTDEEAEVPDTDDRKTWYFFR